MTYGEVKALIKSKCGLTDVILDNLVREGNTKKVTVGLVEEADAAILVRILNGIYISGQQLFVEDMRYNKPKQQKLMSVKDLLEESQKDMYQSSYREEVKPQADFSKQSMFQGYQNQMMVPQNQMLMVPVDFGMTNMTNVPMQQGMYNYFGGMTGVQTPYQGFGGNQTQFPEKQMQQKSFGFGNGQPNAQESRSGWETDQKSVGRGWETDQKSFGRHKSPNRDWSDNGERSSRWNAPNQENRDMNMRSPSRWERNSFESTRFGNQYPNEGSGDNNYRQKRSVVFSETFTSTTFRNNGKADAFESGFSNVLGDHVKEQPYESAPWDDTSNERNRWNGPNSRNNDRKQRWDEPKFPSHIDRKPRDGPKLFQLRDRSMQRPPRPESRRDFQKTTTKRFRDQGDDRGELEPKRFAGQYRREDSSRPGVRGKGPAFQPSSRDRFNKPINPSRPSNSQYNQPKAGQLPKSNPKFKNVPQREPAKSQGLTHKDSTWRFQAASQVAKEMLKNLEITDMGHTDNILGNLKSHIRLRIENILGTKSATMQEIAQLYRQKFPEDGDQAFFLTVLDDMKNENANVDKIEEKPGSKPVTLKKEKTEPKGAKPKVQPKSAAGPQRLPKYPNADKAGYSQQKQIQKQELENDNFYEVPADLKTALDEETDVLCDLFMAECENPDAKEDEATKKICERMMDHAADDFRKVMRLSVTKRLLNIKTGLLVRIFSGGKLPKRDELDAFLKKYGVTNVKKSDKNKMFIANVNNYKNYDALCKLSTAEIGDKTVTIKPMYMTGPPQKVTRQQIIADRRKFIESQIDRSRGWLLGEDKNKPDSQQTGEGHENETFTPDDNDDDGGNSSQIEDVDEANVKEEDLENDGDDLENVGDDLENVCDDLENIGDDLNEDDLNEDDLNEDDLEDY